MQPLFTGVGVALVTVFDADGRVTEGPTAELAAKLVECGIRAVLVAGTTGEAVALSDDERTVLIHAVREAVPADVPVIAGTGAATGAQAARLTAAAADAGADAALVLSPPRVADPRRYYDTVTAGAGDLPVLAYHYPTASAPGIALDVLADLPVTGIKDSSGDPARLLAEVGDPQRPVWVGSSALVLMAGPVGAAGAILALANAEPERCVAAFGGDGAAQVAMLSGHRRVGQFPVGLKSLVADRWGYSAACRVGA